MQDRSGSVAHNDNSDTCPGSVSQSNDSRSTTGIVLAIRRK